MCNFVFGFNGLFVPIPTLPFNAVFPDTFNVDMNVAGSL
jgi:hypothetical protein